MASHRVIRDLRPGGDVRGKPGARAGRALRVMVRTGAFRRGEPWKVLE